MERINPCDHTAVGALIYNPQGDLLMFERNTLPLGVAGPAGHCDGDNYLDALVREVREEVGLQVIAHELITSFTIHKACRRPFNGSPYHVWQFYAVSVVGTLLPCQRETKRVRWYASEEIRELMVRAEQYHVHHTISEQDYEAKPGLDFSWYRLFQEFPELLK